MTSLYNIILSMFQLAAITVLLVAPLVALGDVNHVHNHQGMRREVKEGDEASNAFRDEEFRRDREHIQEHMGGKKIDLDNATPEELDFHFFKIHDSDNNNKLDGLELLSAMSHAFEAQMNHLHQTAKDDPTSYERNLAYVKDHIILSTDKILEDLDNDDDGFINYMEYTKNLRTKAQLMHMAKHYART